MDDSREDIEPYIVDYLSKHLPDSLEALDNEDSRRDYLFKRDYSILTGFWYGSRGAFVV
jgi:hypothetical protein